MDKTNRNLWNTPKCFLIAKTFRQPKHPTHDAAAHAQHERWWAHRYAIIVALRAIPSCTLDAPAPFPLSTMFNFSHVIIREKKVLRQQIQCAHVPHSHARAAVPYAHVLLFDITVATAASVPIRSYWSYTAFYAIVFAGIICKVRMLLLSSVVFSRTFVYVCMYMHVCVCGVVCNVWCVVCGCPAVCGCLWCLLLFLTYVCTSFILLLSVCGVKSFFFPRFVVKLCLPLFGFVVTVCKGLWCRWCRTIANEINTNNYHTAHHSVVNSSPQHTPDQ